MEVSLNLVFFLFWGDNADIMDGNVGPFRKWVLLEIAALFNKIGPQKSGLKLVFLFVCLKQ